MTAPQSCSLCARPEADHDDAACPMGWTPALPPLRVWTARVSYRGADRLDITRKSAGPAGLPFAPSWAILRPALDARRRAQEIARVASSSFGEECDDPGDHGAEEAASIEAEAWERYVPAYTAEMRASYRVNVEAWKELLARREVTLCCYCAAPPGGELHCHRRVLASLLVKCGAVYEGER